MQCAVCGDTLQFLFPPVAPRTHAPSGHFNPHRCAGAGRRGRRRMIRPPAVRLRVLGREDDPLRRVATRPRGGEGRSRPHQALQVLVVLVERQGVVVTRDVLFEQVWPDTMPTDDVLTQAITQLRKAFGDDREAPRYIETISKTGYRLLAPAQWLDDEILASTGPAAQPTSEAIPTAGPGPSDGLPA